MSCAQTYRRALCRLTPSAAWTEGTLRAMEEAGTSRRPRHVARRAALAAVLAAVLLCGLWLALAPGRSGPLSAHSGEARPPAPVPTPGYVPDREDEFGTFIVMDPAQQIGSNPTTGRTHELTELPVWENTVPTRELQRNMADGLAAQMGTTLTGAEYEVSTGYRDAPFAHGVYSCANGVEITMKNLLEVTVQFPEGWISDQMADAAARLGPVDTQAAGTQVLEEYTFDGELSQTSIIFPAHPEDSLEDQLLDYGLHRYQVTQVPGPDGAERWRLTFLMPDLIENARYYPLRTEEAAVADFRSGNYWGTPTGRPGDARVLSVGLEYAAEEYHAYTQPVYRILYTQDYWDISGVLREGVDPAQFTSVSCAYVPAVAKQYEAELDDRLYINDAEAKNTAP